MAASANIPQTYTLDVDPLDTHLSVAASVTIFAGAAVSRDASGDISPLVTTDSFAGFALQKIDNSSGAASDEDVKVRERGCIVLSVATADDDDDVGSAVYASDDNTFTLTAAANLQIGKVRRHISGTSCVVYFESDTLRSI